MAKYVFITGGVASSSGKGITAASLGALLKARGLRVTMKKFDPYLNVDPGTMNPYQHGEVFVTDDGMETDLDLGHYERFIDESLRSASSTTQGQVYQAILEDERRGVFEGVTVQVVPHVTGEIKKRIMAESENYDVVLCEIGGTVGDIEGQPFLEAIRQLRLTLPLGDCLFIHVTILPYVKAAQELKTKPTQHSVKAMQTLGLQPDFIVCRANVPVQEPLLEKIAMFCNVPRRHVVVNEDSPSLYAVPLMLRKEGFDDAVLDALRLDGLPAPELAEWRDIVRRHVEPVREVRIALCGKYMQLHDAYLSVVEALTHAGIAHTCRVRIDWVDSDRLDDMNAEEILAEADGILVPGGFGVRGMEGMISAIRYARENRIPFFGICLGLQMAVVEYARHMSGLAMAHTTEADPSTPYPVVDIMPDQKAKIFGGTMRLGGYACALQEGSLAEKIYGEALIRERHRHRYEVNDDLKERLCDAGLVISGENPESGLCEIIELPEHPFFIGVQYHPEFLSRPMRPHPIFRDFIGAAIAQKNSSRAEE